MISRLSDRIAYRLYACGVVPEQSIPLYSYAVFRLVFALVPFLLVVTIGTTMGMLIEGLMMIVPFMLLRKFFGGYHMKSHALCLLSSVAILSLTLSFIKNFEASNQLLYAVITSAAAVELFAVGTIDSEARKLSCKELLVFSAIGRTLIGLVLLAFFFAKQRGQLSIAMSIGASIILAAILHIISKIKKAQANH